MTDQAFDTRVFRQSLGQFPTGVCIVTARVGDELLGMTISSFNSLSLDPPLVLFSVDQNARSLPLWLQADGYAINVLSETQRSLSNRFARPSDTKWEGVTFGDGLYGAPVLPGASAVFQCARHSHHQAGDHTLFITLVESFTSHAARQPLVFCKGSYGALKPGQEAAPIWPLDIHY